MNRPILTLAVLAASILTIAAEDPSLPPAAEAAMTKYRDEVAKADSDRDKRIETAKAALVLVLQREMESQTKAGKLDGALAVRAKLDAVKKGEGTAAQSSDLFGNPVATPAGENRFKIPAMSWQPLGKTGARAAFMLGPFPKGTDPAPILGYLSAGDFKKPYLGVALQRETVDGTGNLNCTDQDNSDTYWLVYVKAAGKQPVEALVTAQANPSDETNSSAVYWDGKTIESGGKVSVTANGHAIVLRQMHNSAYRNAWIRILSEQPLLIVP